MHEIQGYKILHDKQMFQNQVLSKKKPERYFFKDIPTVLNGFA